MNIPIAVTFLNGNTVRTLVDQFNLSTYLGRLNMDDVTGIRYGKDVDPVPADIRLANVDVTRNGSDFAVKLFNRDDKQVAVINTDAVKLQEFACRILNQTTYAFDDVQHRMDGLDK